MSSACGRYQLLAEVGRGGMGTVFLGLGSGPGEFRKLVAIKRLRPEHEADASYRAMLLEEGRIGARLTHPGIVQTLDAAEDPKRGPYLVMEYVEGPSLRRFIRKVQPESPERATRLYLRTLVDVLDALDFAHHARGFDGSPLGIVHRDVSPQNLLLTYEGTTKLFDFGIAKAADGTPVTTAGTLKGKLSYMSPEQARADSVDARSDVFSVGVMMWEALAGRKLWDGLEIGIVLELLRHGRIPSPRGLMSRPMPDLEHVCMQALSRDPDRRFQTAREMREALVFVLTHGRILASHGELAEAVHGHFDAERARVHGIIARRLHELSLRPSSAPPSVSAATGYKVDECSYSDDPVATQDTTVPTLRRESVTAQS